MNVMIVDDSAEMRELLRDLISPLTQSIVECGNGLECIARSSECQPDWIIMDLRMPRLDGLNAARAVRACWPASKVLLVTHFNSPAIAAEAQEAGVISCVSKDELYQLVDLMKGGPPASAEPTPGRDGPPGRPRLDGAA